jgi:hypothetical protein
MARWLFERGIGEDRAILVDGNDILEAVIELPGLRAGTVAEARLVTILIPQKRGIVRLDSGEEALLEPLPGGVTQGAKLRVEIVREAIGENGRDKLPKARPSEEPVRQGPALIERIGHPAPSPSSSRDEWEDAGWTELLEAAASGEIDFPGGALRMSLTPAMTLFDVDGWLDLRALAIAGAAAAGQAIRQLGIAGSIGIDLPTLPAKADRLLAAEALDAALPPPFERTAVNGFGFLQVVRRRERASLPKIVQGDPAGAAARALLRRAGRHKGALTLVAAPPVVARLERESGWLDALSRQCGGAISLSAEAARPIFGGYVHPRLD